MLRPLWREKLRTALTVLGIAVGVAVVVAIELANQSALRAFRESVDAVAGRANYQITADGGSLDEQLLLRLQPLWPDGLRFAPVIDVEGVVVPSQQPLRVLAVDLLSDLHFRDYRYTQIETSSPQAASALELFRNDSVVVPAVFAAEQHLKLGSTLTIDIGGHPRRMTVRGILDAHGPATAFNGAIAVVDISTAQAAFAMQGRLSRIDLIVPEANAARILPAIRSSLPSGTRLERPSRRNDRVEKMLRAFRVNLFALAGVALLVGIFLVYNTVLISILRRRREVGILRQLGVTPREIFRAFLAEGFLFGTLGSLLGLILGNLLARGILGMIGRTINSLYVTSRPEAIALTPDVMLTGMAVGVLLSLAAAIQPSLEAASTPPATLIRVGLQQRLARRNERWLVAAPALCIALAAGLSRLPPLRGIAVGGYAAVLFIVIAFSLLAPLFVRAASGAVAPLFRALFGIVGQLAAKSLPASLRRTSIASAALSLAIGMMVAVALMVGSFRETVRVWVDQTISSDLWLRPARGLTNAPSAVFPPAILGDLQRFPFILAADPARGRDIVFRDSIITAGSGDFRVAAAHGDLPMITPRLASNALRDALTSGGVLVSESFSLKFGKSAGDRIVLPTAHGSATFPITGVYRDYSNDRGVVVMDRELYIRSYDDASINTIIIYLRPGVDPLKARVVLERELGPKYHAFAVTNGAIRREVMTIFDQTFLITYALLAVAIIVAVLGIVNTLSALILERRRELALLRISGMTTRELTLMMVLESSLLGVISTVAGAVMGYVLSWVLIYVINKQSFGWTIEFHTPWSLLAASLTVTFLAASAAGLIPSRLASQIDLAGAMKGE